ncbi:MAG TPA: hypothetical protein VG326_05780 [Tepidisphaeraceae bacterium]|jgi:hypothetical protein|nr:hypothetical protein [Tepidisphaeraceae bacterium]
MFLIRNWKSGGTWVFCAAAFSALGGGCTTPNVIKTPSPIAAEPPADQATELRGFKKSVAFYHSGATQAWPTRWYYSPNPDYTSVENYIADPVMAIAQTVSVPATILVDYPFRKIYYAGDVMPVSYTAMPPLPPEPLNSLTVPDPDPLSAPQEPVLPPIVPLPVERPPLILPPPETRPVQVKTNRAKTAPAPRATAPATQPVR